MGVYQLTIYMTVLHSPLLYRGHVVSLDMPFRQGAVAAVVRGTKQALRAVPGRKLREAR